MRGLHIASIVLVSVLIVGVLVFWWAGFAPFPTAPVQLASYQNAGTCKVPADSDNWAMCAPGMPNPSPVGSEEDYRAFPTGTTSATSELGRFDSWGVEGYNGCWDDGCRDVIHGDVPDLQWKIYYKTEAPHYGLGTPKWVVTIRSRTNSWRAGVVVTNAYTTYGACMYRIPPDTNTDHYSCKQIDPKPPWVIGAIHEGPSP